MRAVVRVAVGVLRDQAGRVLIALRPSHKHQGDFWEFPGGKIEFGESSEAALQREVFEELGVVVRDSLPLISVPFSYPEKQVLLEVREVTVFEGEPQGKEGQIIRWVSLEELSAYTFPPANAPIIKAVCLPELVCVTGEYSSVDAFRVRMGRAISRGAGMILFRPVEGGYPSAEMVEVAADICRKARVDLVLSSAFPRDLWGHADGVHLRAEHMNEFQERPIGTAKWLGASCHNLREAKQAKALGVDYLFLSPVQATESHPGSRALGWEEFSVIAEQVGIPVYALGGVQCSQLPEARRAGARGIAGISAFWKEI